MSNMTAKPSNSIRRWGSRSTTQTSIALVDRTNTQRSTTTAATATSSFLPELNSTPPMPTFQKPDMATSTPMRRLQQSDLEFENSTPTSRKPDRGMETLTDMENYDATPTRGSYIPRRPLNTSELPTISDPGDLAGPSYLTTDRPPNPTNRLPPSARPKPATTTALKDRIGDTPPLPKAWTQQHDRAICALDARGYGHQAIVSKMRRTFRELGGILTPAMIDKRLRQLDQNVDIDYWQTALEAAEREKEKRLVSPPSGMQAADSSLTLAGIEDMAEARAIASAASLHYRP